MENLRVKICGITNLADARYCAGAGADYLGFIQSEASSRYVEPDMAREIFEWVAGVKTVGVFVDADVETLNETASAVGFDIVQLHGDESVEYCSQVARPVIKVFRIRNDDDPAALQKKLDPYIPHVYGLLFDTFVENQPGGTGRTFSWETVSALDLDVPLFLAGGLNAANAAEAVTAVGPYGIDVSSGVEQSPGMKDFAAVDDLFAALAPFRAAP
ncbi:MAG TPA: phosphoribosylanthranilate isomerase [Rhodothermales bacterium]|nr:phosphoribosylanthranilate isomerase [Rhodothermales bacterium]